MIFFDEVQKLLRRFADEYVPYTSLDLVILGFHHGNLKVLLLKVRGIDGWLLPGGRIRKDESLQTAAYRTLKARTNLEDLFLQQFQTFGERNRLESFANALAGQPGWPEFMASLKEEELAFLTGRALSVGFYALVDYTKVNLVPDFTVEECRWWNLSEVPTLMMDHNHILQQALKSLRRQLNYQPIGYNLLPEKFTMTELQTLYETILDKSLDRRNFNKQMTAYEILERVEKRPTSSGKSPYLYRFIKDRYDELLESEGLYAG